jgi:hypothetical protein
MYDFDCLVSIPVCASKYLLFSLSGLGHVPVVSTPFLDHHLSFLSFIIGTFFKNFSSTVKLFISRENISSNHLLPSAWHKEQFGMKGF